MMRYRNNKQYVALVSYTHFREVSYRRESFVAGLAKIDTQLFCDESPRRALRKIIRLPIIIESFAQVAVYAYDGLI